MTDRYEKIRKALKMGPTQGSWVAQIGARHIEVETDDWIIFETDTHRSDSPPRAQCIANACLIAACDPDTILALLDERDELLARAERLAEALRELEGREQRDEALLRQALEALEGVAQWVEKRPDTHPWDAWQRVEPAITALRIALEQQAQAQPVYRCHIDLEEGMEPDDCVLDSGRRDDCVYARFYGDRAREHCGEWKPIQIAKHPPQPRRMGGADGG